jgi:hypothetical protein
MTATTHTCPAPDCRRQVTSDKLACRSCWYSLPRDIRARVWAGYRSEPGGAAHMGAIADAIRFWSKPL